MNKQVYELSIRELNVILKSELSRVTALKKYKEIKKVNILINAIKNAEIDTLKIEGVRGNENGREMVNAGSVIECLVKHYRKGYQTLFKTFNSEKSDEIDGFMNYEIKASLPNARNTALTEPKSVILINATGAYLINKAISLEVPMDSQGRYYENMDYSGYGATYIKSLSEKLGL